VDLAKAILPTAAIDVSSVEDDGDGGYTLLASQASFGIWPKEGAGKNDDMILISPPEDDPLLCNESEDIVSYAKVGSIPNSYYNGEAGTKYAMIVPRGTCTFERKALSAQRLGADGIIIYGSLGSFYSVNQTVIDSNGDNDPLDSVIWPEDKHDYDCDNGRGFVPRSSMVIPYSTTDNDKFLSGSANDGNLCAKNDSQFQNKCSSERCLLTGEIVQEEGVDMMEACCAWDFHIWLYHDSELSSEDVEIQALFITMKESTNLINSLKNDKNVKVVMYRRPTPTYNFSSVVIWLMGTAIAVTAGYLSASEYRDLSSTKLSSIRGQNVLSVNRREMQRTRNSSEVSDENSPETLDITMGMVLGFVLMSTASLLILFYLKIYSIVKVFYAFACAGAVYQIVVLPVADTIIKRFNSVNAWWYMDYCKIPFEDDYMSRLDIFALIISYTWCGYWLYLAFTLRHPAEESAFFWITQDIMGAAICIMFVALIRVPKLSIASALLWALFVYDIFFVFISPLLFDSSVMITVATSGGPPTADPTWCEKYPDSSGCTGGDPMPMLITFPRLGDYRGGASMLGLGDIVIPGVLLSFVCRFDEAKRLVGLFGGGRGGGAPCRESNNPFCCLSFESYFIPVSFAYALGLMMANAAVYLMDTGQPALLYLVPMTLGTVYILGKQRNELSDLWNGPKVINAADQIYAANIEYERSGESATLRRGGSTEVTIVAISSEELDSHLSSTRSLT